MPILLPHMGWGMKWSKWKCLSCGIYLEFDTKSKLGYYFSFVTFCVLLGTIEKTTILPRNFLLGTPLISLVLTEVVCRFFAKLKESS